MTRITVRTAAKVNLCLRVLGRRADGYHEVETVLHTIGVWDRLHVQEQEAPGIALQVLSGEAPADQSNLCWQAASVLAARTNTRRGVLILLEKGIPARSGLGGGSSDAAATLTGLACLWSLGLAPDELEGIAAEVGSDVPFFIRGGCCLARGKGEKLSPCPELCASLVLVSPGRGIATAQAYASLGRGATRGRRRAVTAPIKRVLEGLESGDLGAIAAALHNDFEGAPISGIGDALEAKRQLLEAGCLGASMSGSGSVVFGIASDPEEAARVAGMMKGRWPWVVVAEAVGAGRGLVVEQS